MEIDIENLPASSESLTKMILYLRSKLESQIKETATYKEKYDRLIEELRLAKQHRFSPSSEKNVLQPDLFDEVDTELSEELKDQLDDTVEVKAYIRKKHPIRLPLPSCLPREVIVYDISEEEKICACGAHLVRIGEETSEQLKYIPARMSVVQHVRPKYACKPCQEGVKIAAMPLLLLPKSIATPELVTQTIISKYCDHIPLYRQEAIWKRLEIDMPRSSLCGWLLKTAELCEPLVKLLRQTIVSYDYVQADETTVQVLNEPGRINTSKSYMWCYRGGGEHKSIVYEYEETRAGYHAQEFLNGFKGYLQTDAYAGYNWAHADKEITPVGCHAHARRPFAELVKLSQSRGLAHEAIKFYEKLYAVEKTARENNYSFERRYQLRQQKSLPILTAFKEWLDKNLLKTSEQMKIGKAIRYCLSNWDNLMAYLTDGRIEIDNNLIENAIRPFALGRKNWIFNGSPRGAKAGATFYSLIETCKRNSVDLYQYFCAMLHEIRKCQSDDDYRRLLPQFIVL